MAVYCGTDIIEIDRIKKSLLEIEGFRDRVFTEQEINYCENRKNAKYESYAARFAAKEAISKALGTGLSGGICLKQIEILNNGSGKPYAVFHGKAQEFYAEMKAKSMDVSISHCGTYAVAYAVIEV